ncbi:MAG: hypothetical protein HYY22_10215 [Thaumarchaeota archaeon]|nr:hypothetical protein [Nitrososphaerota archaeon]
MASRKQDTSRKQDDTPSEFKRMQVHTPPKNGKVPIADLFNGIYQTAASAEVKKVAPEELAKLKEHLDAAVNILQTIANKVKSSKVQ